MPQSQRRTPKCNFSADRFANGKTHFSPTKNLTEDMQSRCTVGGAKKTSFLAMLCWCAFCSLYYHGPYCTFCGQFTGVSDTPAPLFLPLSLCIGDTIEAIKSVYVQVDARQCDIGPHNRNPYRTTYHNLGGIADMV